METNPQVIEMTKQASIKELIDTNAKARDIAHGQIRRVWELIDASNGPNLVDPEHAQSFADATGVFDTVTDVITERTEEISDLSGGNTSQPDIFDKENPENNSEQPDQQLFRTLGRIVLMEGYQILPLQERNPEKENKQYKLENILPDEYNPEETLIRSKHYPEVTLIRRDKFFK